MNLIRCNTFLLLLYSIHRLYCSNLRFQVGPVKAVRSTEWLLPSQNLVQVANAPINNELTFATQAMIGQSLIELTVVSLDKKKDTDPIESEI